MFPHDSISYVFPHDSIGYVRNGTLHVRDTGGKHWTVQAHLRSQKPFIKKIPKKGVQLHGRPSGSTIYSDILRNLSHRLMNAVTQEGSWAFYTGSGEKKVQRADVLHRYIPKRIHIANMNKATMQELGEQLSATDYARRGHGAYFTKGHSHIPYEWCHLVAHGLGGKDASTNIVAATKYQNTEQLILEAVLYQYRMEGLSVKVQAKLASGTMHLAESIYYEILLNGRRAYSKTMDARRATNVTYSEFTQVAKQMRQCINSALKMQYPIIGVDEKVLKHVDDLTEVTEDCECYFRIC